jgi:hypothetical protein
MFSWFAMTAMIEMTASAKTPQLSMYCSLKLRHLIP